MYIKRERVMKVLHVLSSINGEKSFSLKLSNMVLEKIKSLHAAEISVRDVVANPLDHLITKDFATLAENPCLVDFLEHDVIVIAAPMYNFAMPSQLKAWIDRLAVAGKTFQYTQEGPKGLVANKKIIIASARGGFYANQHNAPDHQESYLKDFFNFIGVTDVQFIRVEGLGMGEAQVKEAFDQAEKAVNALEI
ncbi:MAG: FMN-dependent NADH-azoreductase 1 [Holosporales bacterium]